MTAIRQKHWYWCEAEGLCPKGLFLLFLPRKHLGGGRQVNSTGQSIMNEKWSSHIYTNNPQEGKKKTRRGQKYSLSMYKHLN